MNMSSLVRRAQERDHEAFLTLAEALRPKLWARATSWSDTRERAEDLFQETLLRAYKNISEVRHPEAISSWMLTILDRLARLENSRDRKHEPREALDEVSEIPSPDQTGQSFLELSEFSEAKEELQAAISKLPQSDRELLALRFGSGMNASRISEVLSLTPGAVRARLFRAITHLRKRLGVRL